jgi:hypothetical protein
VTAAGRARPRGFVLLSRRGAQNPSILTVFSVFLHLPQVAFPTAVLANTSIFRQRSRTSAQRPVFRLPAGTLDCVPKAAQTADTGVTGWDWRFGCAFNLCFQ